MADSATDSLLRAGEARVAADRAREPGEALLLAPLLLLLNTGVSRTGVARLDPGGPGDEDDAAADRQDLGDASCDERPEGLGHRSRTDSLVSEGAEPPMRSRCDALKQRRKRCRLT